MLWQLPPSVAAFQALFEGTATEIDAWLRDDVALRPPTYGKTWTGKELVCRLLGFASEEFGGLVYTDAWSNGDRYALRFEGEIDGKPFQGIDVVHLDRAGNIALIEIFARPPAAMLALRDRMSLHVRNDPVASRLMGLAA
ncbi:MAG: hypothetical protein WA978_17330 [Sphingopyxis granuli]|uniref:hypothetical protein n=1 Tax=Sphingopyxis granuli TaxID=267128 RepID=UPI003C74A85C